MVRTDIFQRAIPWSQLILESRSMPNDLNLQLSQKVSSLLVFLITFTVPLAPLSKATVFEIPISDVATRVLVTLLVLFFILNRDLYSFYRRKRGMRFMLQVVPLHFLYYFYSGAAFVYCWLANRASRLGILKARP
jgi:hypothetical protein